MKTIFVSNLPPDSSEDSVRKMFSDYGTVRGISVSRDIFSGKCRGFGNVDMEGHEARAAIAALDGKQMGSQALRVRFDNSSQRKNRRR